MLVSDTGKLNFLKTVFIIAGLLFTLNSLAQDTIQDGFIKRISKKRFFSTQNKHHGFIAHPLLYYTPETRLAFGISTILYFRSSKKDSSHRASVTHPFFGYTQNHQIFVEAPFQLFFKKEKFYIYGEVAYYKYPYKFFGIGNRQPVQTDLLYQAIYPSCSLTVMKKIFPRFYLGFRYNFDYYKMSYQDTTNVLFPQTIVGRNGGLNNGIGLQFLYDTRDNIFAPQKGAYIEFISVFDSKKITLSNYTYQNFVFDVRKYLSFKRNNIIALQYYLNLMGGSPPFYQLAMLGGDHRMRGYYEGRYRDKNYTATQVEYRSPFIKNRVGFAAFAGTGVVFPNFKQFDLNYLKPSIGGGLRLRFNRKEKIHFRIDVAYGQSWNYYFVLSEAF